MTEQEKSERTSGGPAAAGERKRLGKGVSALLILATLFGVIAFVTIWANRQLAETGYWEKTSEELIQQPEIRDALSTYLVDQLFANTDVQARIQQQLPPDLKILAGPATSGLRELAGRAADRAINSPRFQEAWIKANEIAHENAMQIIKGGNEKISTEGGVVTIDLKLLLEDLSQRTGVGGKLAGKLPADAAKVVVLQSDELKTAQDAYKTFRALSIVSFVLTILFFALAIALAAGRRRRAVAYTGASFTAVGAGVLLLAKIAEPPTVDTLAKTAAVRPAVRALFDVSTGLLRDQAASIMFTGVLILLGAWLAGNSRPAVSFRRSVAPYLRFQTAAAAAVAVILYLLLIWWAPVMGFRTAGGLIINTTLAVCGFIALTVLTRREFPDAAEPDFEAIANRAKAAVSRERFDAMRDKAKSAIGRGESTADELERLAGLHDRGVLTDDEFAAQKQRLLDA